MKGIKSFFLFLFLFFSVSSISAQQLNLANLKDWKIVITDSAIPSEKFAAQEFQGFFEKAAGIKLEIVNAPKKKVKNIFIGSSDYLNKSDCAVDINDLGNEGLRIKIKQDNIAIAGGKPRGTLYGVYEFAEKYLGIRFLAYDYTYIPAKKQNIMVPCEEYSYVPCFVYRSVFYKENIDHPEFSVKLRNNAYAKSDTFGGVCNMQFVVHSFYRQLPVEKYGKEHPEYFAEVGGKRLLEAYGGGPQIDVSNPDVIKVMTDAVIKEIGEHPEVKNVSVVQNDNQYYCRCSNCEAINKKEGSPMGAHLAMVNDIADSVKVKYPDVEVGTLAYQYTRKPPATIVPRDNVMVQLCSIECDLLHSYAQADNEWNKPFADDFAGWSKICKNLWIWDYMVDFYKYGMPFPNLQSIGENIKYYKDHNVKGVFMEANYNCVAGEMSDLKNYITSRCLWNPELNSWDLTREFCTLYYKSAAPPILDYLTKLQDNVELNQLKARFNARPSDVGLNATFAEWSLSKFNEAMKLADDDSVRNRVERASLCAYVAVIEASQGELQYSNSKVNYQSSQKYKEVLKTFPTLAKKHHMTFYVEDDKADIDDVEKDFKDQLKVYSEGGRPAAQIKNNDWRFTILNEENGRCIEMRNVHNDINLLSADKTDLGNGLFSEHFLKGEAAGDTIVFKSTIDKNVINLSSALKDGTQYMRQITASDDGSNKLVCKSTITNKTDSTKTYQLKVDFYTNTGVRKRDTTIINASVKHNGKFEPFNAGLIGTHGPHEQLITEGKDGGAFLLFNSERKSGVLETYAPDNTAAIDASWTDGGSYMNLGFKTKEVTLKPGESFTFSYDFKYLNELPAN